MKGLIPAVIGALLYAGASMLFVIRGLSSMPELGGTPVEEKTKLPPRLWNFNSDAVNQLIADLQSNRDQIATDEKRLVTLKTQLDSEKAELAKMRGELEGMRKEIDERVLEIQESEIKNLKTLSQTYSAMPPAAAVAIFREMDENMVVKILAVMKVGSHRPHPRGNEQDPGQARRGKHGQTSRPHLRQAAAHQANQKGNPGMIPVSSAYFPEAPSAPSKGAPSNSCDEAVRPFEEMLAEKSGENTVSDASVGRDDQAPETADLEEKGVVEKDARDPEQAGDDQDANALMLSSCLAVWQNLPPQAPTPPAPPSGGAASEGIDVEFLSGEPTTTNDAETNGNSLASGSPAAPKPATLPAAGANPSPLKVVAEEPPKLTTPGDFDEMVGAPATGQNQPADTVPLTPTTSGPPTKGLPSGKASSIAAPVTPIPDAESPQAELDGIPVAKEHRAMSDLVFHHSAKIAPAAFAEGETPLKTMPEGVQETVAATQIAEQSGSENSHGGLSGGHQEQSASEPFPQFAAPELRRDTKRPRSNRPRPHAIPRRLSKRSNARSSACEPMGHKIWKCVSQCTMARKS